MSAIKAIETAYKGYRFRSRLEARWAVFFDALGLKWEYEPEGFETSAGWYLPDFWLPTLCTYVEVKGRNFSDIDIQKLNDVGPLRGYSAILVGNDPLDLTPWGGHDQTESTGGTCEINDGYRGTFGVDKRGRATILIAGDNRHWFYASSDFSIELPTTCEGAPSMAAVQAFRSARFEHGERPL